ncbi:hypothetical protein [Pedobacter sp. MW01-1-1]|uniref:hypothetical protein n=1 Tax=Pedobacter sp. MW01-1-1 TaxID=3383027 RepID=UPI003FEF0E67
MLVSFLGFGITACNTNKATHTNTDTNHVIVKGLYSFGPELKFFSRCDDGREYWVADTTKTLELSYSKLGFEKPYKPVYVELEGFFTKSDTAVVSADFDSTLVVTKVNKISTTIPEGPCSQ